MFYLKEQTGKGKMTVEYIGGAIRFVYYTDDNTPTATFDVDNRADIECIRTIADVVARQRVGRP